MQIKPFEFNQLINPLTSDQFLSDYWEKKPLLLTDRPAEKYENILSLKNVDFLLSSMTSPHSLSIKFYNNNREQPLQHFLKENGLLDKDKVLEGFHEGNTIILNQLQNRLESVRQLCYGIEDFFGHRVGANMYLTPSNAQGFGAHFDSHDVFILQLEGEKLWKIYDIFIEYPLTSKDIAYEGELKPPLYEVYLKPGDLLYLPRGYVHEACTTKNYSLHLTVGVYPLTWMDLIKEIAGSRSSLRKALPPRMLLTKPEDSENDLSSLESLSFGKEEIFQAIKKLQKKFIESRIPSFHEHFTTLEWVQHINEDTILKKKENLTCSQITKEEQVFLYFGNSALSLPDSTEHILTFILNSPNFSIKTLPGELSVSSKLIIVRQLAKHGLLTLVN